MTGTSVYAVAIVVDPQVHAQGLHVSHRISFWDAMILASCLEVGVEILYSEDVPGLDAVESSAWFPTPSRSPRAVV